MHGRPTVVAPRLNSTRFFAKGTAKGGRLTLDQMSEPEKQKRESEDDKTGFGSTDLMLLLMTVIWGSNFTAIKYSLEDLLPLSFNALRFTIASLIMIVIALRSRGGVKLAPGDGWRLFGLGLLGNTVYQS